MSENEYKSKKSRSTFVARVENDKVYLVVTGEAETKSKVIKEVERIRFGGGTFFEVDSLAKQMAATY